MKVQELMERIGVNETGKAIAYIKDALLEINILAETDIKTARINVTADKRYYNLPSDMVKVTDIRVKNHLNSKNEYRTIPRLVFEPKIEDTGQEL